MAIEKEKEKVPSKDELQNFVLKFERHIVEPLVKLGFERNKYNLFDILRLNRRENSHSDFLAFLMNPSQSGSIGQQFLRNFFALLSKEKNESYVKTELDIDFFSMFYGEFENVSVKREIAVDVIKERMDILLTFKVKDKNYVVVIENKVDAGERIANNEKNGQLETYRKAIEKEKTYKDHAQIYLYLSPNRREPNDDKAYWFAIDYGLIYKTLCRLNMDTADNTIKALVDDYKKLIRSEFEMDIETKLKEAAVRIYSDPANKDVFDFIIKNIPNRVNVTANIIRNYINDKSKAGSWTELKNEQNRFIQFVTTDIKNLKLEKVGIYFQFDLKNMEIICYVENATPEIIKELRLKVGSAVCRFTPKDEKNATKSLFGKSNTDEIIERHDAALGNNDTKTVQDDITKMLGELFAPAPKGWVKKVSDEICEICKKLGNK